MQRSTRLVITVTSLVLVGSGCEIGDIDSRTGNITPDTDQCSPQFPGQDPDMLPPCCEEWGGGAHCVPDGLVPEKTRDLVARCDTGGLCIPDDFIAAGGVLQAQPCNSINGTGRCMSVCVPQVQEFITFLTQDVCEDGKMCAPCIDPMTGEPTGACDLAKGCGGPDDEEPVPLACPYDGPPLIDPNQFPACPACSAGGAHCLPNDMVPGDQGDQLGDCDADSKCVPDEFIASMGKHVPATCASLAGAEGRCLSRCLPEVAEQADRLPQSSCPLDEVCVPCFDPLTGEDTQACTQSCDPGPANSPFVFPPCCEGRGTCVPPESITAQGEDPSQLGQDVCPDSPALLCVPDVMLEGDYQAQSCNTGFFFTFLFGDEYGPGACMPDCIPAVDSIFLGQNGCADGMKCAPCLDPLAGGSSGACDYL